MKTTRSPSPIRRSLAAALAMALLATPLAAVELLTNGSFETGKNPTTDGKLYTGVSLPGTDLPGWGGSFWGWYDTNGAEGTTAQNGSRFVNLIAAAGTDVLSQTFSVTAGTVYTVSYYEKQRAGSAYMNATLAVVAGTVTGSNGSPVAIAAGPAASIVQTSATGNAAWTHHSFTFTPSTTTTATLSFQNNYVAGNHGDNDGVMLDNVSVTGSTASGSTASTTALARHAGTGTTSTYGAALSFDVTVAGSSGTPAGTVTLKDGGSGGTTLGSASLTSGTCTITTNTLGAGSHANIVAVYAGDGIYATSTSSALSTQTVDKATPSVTVTGATSFFYNGSPQGPNTATTGGSTGALSFSYVGTGGTSYPAGSTPPTNIGSYTCTATVAADANFLGASSAATVFAISANPVGGTSVDAYLSNTGQIRSASNNPPFGAGSTQNAAAVNLTWYAPLDMAFGADREGAHGKLAGGTLNGIAFHNILLGNGADTATGVSVANAMAGVTMDYTLAGGINRNFPAAIYTGADAAILYNISATNVCRDTHSVVTFHGLTPNNNVYVQLIGGNMWSVPVAVSLNGATPVNWVSQTACKDPGVPGAQDGTNNSALLGLTSTTDGAGTLTIDVYSTGGNGYHGLGAITVAQQLVVITGPPAAPTGLAATPVAPGSVGLTWNPAVGAAGYKVWCENTVNHAVQNFTTTTSPYTVTGLTNGTLYNFKVLGTNSYGDGAYSGVVSATPLASAACDILACDFPGLGAASINGTGILFTVPPGQSRASLAPTFTLSPYATLSPASGTPRDFTNSVTTPVPYTVTAQNGTIKTYYVTVQSYDNWAHAGSLFILTTPDGANLPAGAMETNFPLLVRLNSGNFTFSEAQSDGRDIRFTTAAGAALSYQIEEWDPANGRASIWVLIPAITGNARQEIRMYWGKSGVVSESNAAAVFNAASGYVYWIRKQGGVDTVLAVDQLALDYPAGRVAGNQSFVIQFKAVYPTETKTVDIPVTVNEAQPDPVFTLTAPSIWDGRETITVTPDISNLAACQAAGVATFNHNWSASGVAVLKQITPGVLTLTRSQGSGPLTVTLVMDNGGVPVTSSKIITIQEPATDVWVQRTPEPNEKPVTGQFFARDGTTGKGTIYYNGTQAGATSVFLRVYKTGTGGDVLYSSQTSSGSAYAFSAPIDAGLYKYKVVLSSSTGGSETLRETVTDLVCGDAYIIDGQSNAVAYDYYSQAATYPDLGNYSSTWIRTYGENGESGAPLNGGWGIAKLTVQPCIGVWGMALARNLLETYGIPVCILNGAVGGTRSDQHQANPADHYAAGSRYSIYANLITRVAAAKLTHGIRGALWHQGEADLSNWGGNLDWDYKYYQQNFLDMSAAWKQDMPNLRYYYLFQVFARGCGASGTFTSDMLRDVQRKLPLLYSGNMTVMPTLAFPTGSNCHFNIPDYEKMGLSLAPLVARDIHGVVPPAAINGPNLQRAWFTTASKNEIALEFDQNMQWNALSLVNFFLDRVGGKVLSGSATGKIVKLQLTGTSTALTIGYVVDQFWDGDAGNLLNGSNGIAAMSFYAVPIAASAPSPYANWAADPAQGLTAGVNDGPLDDPDHDGMTNQEEFAFGLNPSNGSSANPVVQPLDKATGRFQYTRRAGTGLTYRIWTSTSLAAWAWDTGAAEVAVTTNGAVETVTVHVSTAPLNGKLFVRVQAQ